MVKSRRKPRELDRAESASGWFGIQIAESGPSRQTGDLGRRNWISLTNPDARIEMKAVGRDHRPRRTSRPADGLSSLRRRHVNLIDSCLRRPRGLLRSVDLGRDAKRRTIRALVALHVA